MATTSSSVSPSFAAVEKILASADPDDNSFECLDLELKLYEPSVIRRTFYKLSLQVHPDKSDHPNSKEAFQKLTNAFEILYDLQSQKEHLEQIKWEQSQAAENEKTTTTTQHTHKKRKTKHDWKEERQRKQNKKHQQQWAERKWEDVWQELQRRERLEREFQQRHSDARLEQRIQGMIWRAMTICRNLDEQAGCPPTFVNGLWAPLFEQQVFREHSPLPGGWEWRWDKTVQEQLLLQQPRRRIYRNVVTAGEETFVHPVPKVEQLLAKAQKALDTNKYCFHTEPRLFLGEIVEYLRDDHDYKDMDDDMLELEQEEQARLAAMGRGNSNSNLKEFDF
jgi:curved DNA-binding protein CbpA